ncbi:MAG: hypothetical protein R3C46_08355 [Hyphomonadaceae bacterium]
MNDSAQTEATSQTVQDLLNEWKAELDQLDLLDKTDSVEAAAARVEARAKRREALSMAVLLATEKTKGVSLAQPKENEFKRGIWPKVVPEVITNAGAGLTFGQIEKAVVGHPVLAGMPYTPNGLRQGIFKLVRNGELKRIGKQYFTPELMESDGPKRKPRSSLSIDRNPISRAIVEMPELASGLTSLQIVRKLQQMPNLELGERNAYVYSSLTNMKRTGALIRDGALYRLPTTDEIKARPRKRHEHGVLLKKLAAE